MSLINDKSRRLFIHTSAGLAVTSAASFIPLCVLFMEAFTANTDALITLLSHKSH